MHAKPSASPLAIPSASPLAISIEQALGQNAALLALTGRLRDSNARFSVIHPLLPEALAVHVNPGPVDEEGWSLLAANAAIASKLRHLQPRLEDALRSAGWQVSSIRIKVAGTSGNKM